MDSVVFIVLAVECIDWKFILSERIQKINIRIK